MKIDLKLRFIILFSFFVGHVAYADSPDPWFTGPLTGQTAEVVPRGHANLYFSANYLFGHSFYNNSWQKNASQSFDSMQWSPQFEYGLTDWLDVEFTPGYVINQTTGLDTDNKQVTGQSMGDTLVMFNAQLLTQDDDDSQPDISVSLGEIIPTGRYDRLLFRNNGTDATGAGSYQTVLGINFQYLAQLNERHYLNSYLTVKYAFAQDVFLEGISAYGGARKTRGRIDPGNVLAIQLAGELTLTQQWVAVMQGAFLHQQASSFHGEINPEELLTRNRFSRHRQIFFPSLHNIGGVGIGSGEIDAFMLTPAMEYNFSENFGVIAGAWFVVAGRNMLNGIVPSLSFNAYW